MKSFWQVRCELMTKFSETELLLHGSHAEVKAYFDKQNAKRQSIGRDLEQIKADLMLKQWREGLGP